MNDNQTIAIIETEVDKYMLEVIDCSNKVKSIFNKVDDEIEKLKASYQCAGANALYSQYEQFNDYYSVIVNNILSYNSDLTSLKKKYSSQMGDISLQLKQATVSLEASGPKNYVEER